jgi:hypothetical protein
VTSLLRALLVASALLSSGALQVAAAIGEDACCAGEERAPCQECPTGIACPCCARCVIHAVSPDVAPARSPGVAITVSAAAPILHASVFEIFQPPRA